MNGCKNSRFPPGFWYAPGVAKKYRSPNPLPNLPLACPTTKNRVTDGLTLLVKCDRLHPIVGTTITIWRIEHEDGTGIFQGNELDGFRTKYRDKEKYPAPENDSKINRTDNRTAFCLFRCDVTQNQGSPEQCVPWPEASLI